MKKRLEGFCQLLEMIAEEVNVKRVSFGEVKIKNKWRKVYWDNVSKKITYENRN